MKPECETFALHAAGKCSCFGIHWTDTAGAELAEYDRESVHGGRFHQCDCPADPFAGIPNARDEDNEPF